MPRCDVCGTSFRADGYHVAVEGRLYDSVDCALRAASSRRRRDDATSAWVSAARERLGLGGPSPNVEAEPADH